MADVIQNPKRVNPFESFVYGLNVEDHIFATTFVLCRIINDLQCVHFKYGYCWLKKKKRKELIVWK